MQPSWRTSSTSANPSQFNHPQPAALPASPGSAYPSNRPVVPELRSTRLPPGVRPAGPLISAVHSGPPSFFGPGPGPSRVSPYNTTDAAVITARRAAEARRAREFNPDYMVYPIPARQVSAPVLANSCDPNNHAAVTDVPTKLTQPYNRPVQSRPVTEAEAREADNKAHLERSLATVAAIEKRAKAYCAIDPAAGFQFAPFPRR